MGIEGKTDVTMHYEPDYVSLSELNRDIRLIIDECFEDERWVVAEVAELNARGRHCYLTLVEKRDNDIVAQARATIWASRCGMLQEFAEVTGEQLKPGMQVMFAVRVTFHERYGFNLDIRGLNADFTIGGMARRKREVLERLDREGLMERNGRLPFPLVPQRVAVISSDSAAGYQDFCHQLETNAHGYRFDCRLFPAAVQGVEAEASMVAQLGRICALHRAFDVVVILRGGGSQVDLSCFDGYDLAAAIARCPLPVITGVGHEKDVTVVDAVAHTRAKTPTAAAELLIARVRDFDARMLTLALEVSQGARQWVAAQVTGLDMLVYRVSGCVERVVATRGRALDTLSGRIQMMARARVAAGGEQLTRLGVRLGIQPAARVEREAARLRSAERELALRARHGLESADAALGGLERSIHNLDPANVLRRGFSISRIDGKAVTDAASLQPGQRLVTDLYRGRIISTVEQTEEESAQGED